MTDAPKQKYELTVKHSVTVQEVDALNLLSYIISYEIISTTIPELPLELFLFKKIESQQINKEPTIYDNFITVCSLSDIYEYPVNEPACTNKFFRKASVRGVVPTLEEAERIKMRIEDLLSSLIRNIKLIEQTATEVVRIISV